MALERAPQCGLAVTDGGLAVCCEHVVDVEVGQPLKRRQVARGPASSSPSTSGSSNSTSLSAATA
jgi:hypothetical protein